MMTTDETGDLAGSRNESSVSDQVVLFLSRCHMMIVLSIVMSRCLINVALSH